MSTTISQPQSVVDWLISLGISNLLTSDNILSGITIHTILKKSLPSQYKNQLLSPGSAINKITNWNNIIKQLQKINIKVSSEDKNQIIHGNQNTVYNILNEIKLYVEEKNKQTIIDINKIDHKTDPKNSKSLLELFILIIIKNLGLNAKQSVALLSNDSKYLAHILAKGFKQQPKPVLNLLKDIKQLLPKIQQFCLNKQNQLFFLKSVKPGLISKFKQISLLSLNILQQFTLSIQPLTSSFQIFKTHLITTIILQYRRHPSLISQICQSIINITKYNKSLLTILIQNFNQKQILFIVYEIMFIAEDKNMLNMKGFYLMMKVEEVINLAIEGLANSEMFAVAALLLIKVLETNYQCIVSSNNNSNKDQQQKNLLQILKNLQNLAIHKKSHIFTYITTLFTFLYIFGEKKNIIAPLFFKLCIQKYKLAINLDQCELFAHNFINLLQQFPSIPNTLIVDAIAEKYENYNKQVINELEIEFLSMIVFGNKLVQQQSSQFNISSNSSKPLVESQKQILPPDQKTSLKIYNILSKLFFQDVAHAKSISDSIIYLILSNNSSPSIIQLSIKMTKVCLAVHFANIRKLNMSKSIVQNIIKLDDNNVFTKRKNMDIEYFLQQIIKVKNKKINQSIQPLLCYTFIQVEQKNKVQAQGLKKVIALLGNTQHLLKKYQDDVKILHEDKKNIKKQRNNQSVERERQREQTINNYNNNSNNYISSDIINRKKLNPGENYSLYLSKISRITDDAQKGLEKYQKLHVEKINKQKLQQIKKIQQEQKKTLLQKKFTNKVLQKGVKIDPRIQGLHQYLYEFNYKQNQLKKQKAYDLSQLHLFNPDQQQPNELQALKYILKRYSRVLKLYFTSYGGKIKNSSSLFDDIIQKSTLMQIPSLWKMFKDHFLDEYMTVRQAQYIVQKINIMKKKSYNDINLLDYEIFQDFIVQAAFTMFSRPPKNFNGKSIAYMLEEVFYNLRLYAAENKIDARVFEDEVSSSQVMDQMTVSLNKKLKQNPDLILPQGYKKIIDKKVVFYHQVAMSAFDQSYSDIVDILDQIIFDKLGFHILQPCSQLITNVYAKPLLIKKKQQKNQQFMQKYFSLNIKRQLANYSNQDRMIARQVAYTISQMVDSVQFGKKYLAGKYMKYTMKQKEEERKKIMEDQQKKREKRDRELKRQLQKHKQQQQNNKKKDEQLKSKQQKNKEEERKKKEKYQNQMKKKVQQYQKKKDQEKRKQEEQIRKAKLKEQEQFDKKRNQLQKAAKIIQQKKQKQKKQKQAQQLSKKQQAIKKSRMLRQKSKDLIQKNKLLKSAQRQIHKVADIVKKQVQ